MRNLFDQKKIGHGGTLDPLATGVLPVALGRGCRLLSYFLNGDKQYSITLTLGSSTDTYDSTGEVIKKSDWSSIKKSRVIEIMDNFLGYINQTPPKYSALKLKGRRYYDLARSGIEFDIQPRKINIKSIDLIHYDPPRLIFKVLAKKGFYARSFANDFGDAISIPSHMSALCRLSSGDFHIENSHTLEDIKTAINNNNLNSIILPLDYIVKFLPDIRLSKKSSMNIKNGQTISCKKFKSYVENTYRIYDNNDNFIGIGVSEIDSNLIKPVKIFN